MPEKTLIVKGDNIQISDGYHTFDELYEHRITLFIALCAAHESAWREKETRRNNVNPVWRSEWHSDGTCFPGWFVLGLGRESGDQITYHLPMSRWSECGFAEALAQAPKFDGHSSEDVLDRLKRLYCSRSSVSV